MSYYGSAIATIAAYGSMMSISYYLGNKYYPIPYDLKKRAISRYPYFFSRIILWFQRELLCEVSLCVPILSITMKVSNTMKIIKKIKSYQRNSSQSFPNVKESIKT
jgi:hypothetical protein